MASPLVLATWSFGKTATAAAWPTLESHGAAIDAVELGCRAVEADPSCNTVGRGGLPDRSGRTMLDGCIMLSPSRCGSVACVQHTMHPVSLARLVMEKTQHAMLVGDGADAFAKVMGIARDDLITPSTAARYQKWKTEHPDAVEDPTVRWRPEANNEEAHRAAEHAAHNRHHDTVGVLALDANGQLAGACSTSGIAYKVPGRVGDSPIIGHGLYVDPKCGAAVATGTGELIMGICGTFLAVESMRRGESPRQAAETVMQRLVDSYELLAEHQAGLIILAPDGRYVTASLRPGYSTSVVSHSKNEQSQPDVIWFP